MNGWMNELHLKWNVRKFISFQTAYKLSPPPLESTKKIIKVIIENYPLTIRPGITQPNMGGVDIIIRLTRRLEIRVT